MRPFNLLEPAAAIFGRVAPRVRLRADEGAYRLAVAEIDPVHGDNFVDDAGKLAAGLQALHLKAKLGMTEIVSRLFQDADEDDVLSPRVLQLAQQHEHFARMKAVRA